MAARTDLVTDPAVIEGLLLARRGQAYYSRALSRLSDADFDGPSLLAGWDRRHLIAHVGLNARALTRLVEWAATGVETPMYASATQRAEEIDFSATLPVQALRNLSDHAAIHLTVEWRDFAIGGVTADQTSHITMQVKLFFNGVLELAYCQLAPGAQGASLASGSDAVIGIESPDGSMGVQAGAFTAGKASVTTGYVFTPM